MALTRDIFSDPKNGSNYVVGERLTSAQFNAILNGMRAIESARNRSAIAVWTAAPDSPVAPPIAATTHPRDRIIYDPYSAQWFIPEDGTDGIVHYVPASGIGAWTEVDPSLSLPAGFEFLHGCARGDGTIIYSGGSDSTSSAERVTRSTDGGLTWSKHTVGTASTTRASKCLYDPIADLFVLAFEGNGGAIYVSDDGATWTARTPPGALSGVAFVDCASNEKPGTGNRVIFTAGSGNYAYASASDNFTTWTASAFPASAAFAITYSAGQGVWYAAPIASSGTTGYVSQDGLSWSAVTTPNGCFDVAGIGDLLVHVSLNSIGSNVSSFHISSDAGAHWQTVSHIADSPRRDWGFSDRQIAHISGGSTLSTAFSLQS